MVWPKGRGGKQEELTKPVRFKGRHADDKSEVCHMTQKVEAEIYAKGVKTDCAARTFGRTDRNETAFLERKRRARGA